MGRPRIGQQKVKVSIPADVLDELYVIAAGRGTSIHDVIRDSLRVYTRRTRRRRTAA